MRRMDLEDKPDDFAAAAAAAGIQSGGAPAAPMSAPTAAASGANAPNARATSRLPWATAMAPAPAFPTTWQGSKEPGQCELVLYALLWLHSVALQLLLTGLLLNRSHLRRACLYAMFQGNGAGPCHVRPHTGY